ncbi:uncharacterized protein EHS24_003136 [Apiotrichum porosum]|uniref:Uncharacterized protein n=1 Tax=Apiotrichum porosum TaxID=105984 RepID=A0A427XFH0_9TREE|nr:uncharacterized protein EHS24_003136 [Apiotrichum porosum]RSH77576.1 hypothetical protein EHS24_003136 [Apiotrichum porosum]
MTPSPRHSSDSSATGHSPPVVVPLENRPLSLEHANISRDTHEGEDVLATFRQAWLADIDQQQAANAELATDSGEPLVAPGQLTAVYRFADHSERVFKDSSKAGLTNPIASEEATGGEGKLHSTTGGTHARLMQVETAPNIGNCNKPVPKDLPATSLDPSQQPDSAQPVNIQRATHDNAELDVTHGIPGSYYINSHVQPVSPPRGESTNGVDSRAQALETSLAAISPPRSSRKTEAQLKMLEEASEPLAPKQRRFQDAPFNKLPTVARR